MNSKEHFARLGTIIDILLKNKADKDQFFFGTAADIRERTDWLKDESLSRSVQWNTDNSEKDILAMKFTYGGFNFHYYELPEIKEQPKKEWEIIATRNGEKSNSEPIIMAVRRLSDNQVFTVGDRIMDRKDGGRETIKGFEIYQENCRAIVVSGGFYLLNAIEKVIDPVSQVTSQGLGDMSRPLKDFARPESEKYGPPPIAEILEFIPDDKIVKGRIYEPRTGNFMSSRDTPIAVRRLVDKEVFMLGDLLKHHKTPIVKMTLREDNDIWLGVSTTSDDGCALSCAVKRAPGEPYTEDPIVTKLSLPWPTFNQRQQKTTREIALQFAVDLKRHQPIPEIFAFAVEIEGWLNRKEDPEIE